MSERDRGKKTTKHSYSQYNWSYGEDNTCKETIQEQGKKHPKR